MRCSRRCGACRGTASTRWSGTSTPGSKGSTSGFEGVDKQFEGVDKRFEGVDKRFEGVDKQFAALEKQWTERFEMAERSSRERFEAAERASRERFEMAEKASRERFEMAEKASRERFGAVDARFETVERQGQATHAAVCALNGRFDDLYRHLLGPREQAGQPGGGELAGVCAAGLAARHVMDPLAHTLVGATLAQTRLREGTGAMALAAGVLAANAPDVDAVTMFVSRDLSLGFRRGWTHGVLAMAVLPLVLTAALLVLDRLWARWRGRGPAARAGPLLRLTAAGVWSHPLLDWLNTYGVRFLMPFDGTWFYGDALFIIDPWVWLMAGLTVVLASSATWASAAGWALLGTAAHRGDGHRHRVRPLRRHAPAHRGGVGGGAGRHRVAEGDGAGAGAAAAGGGGVPGRGGRLRGGHGPGVAVGRALHGEAAGPAGGRGARRRARHPRARQRLPPRHRRRLPRRLPLLRARTGSRPPPPAGRPPPRCPEDPRAPWSRPP